MGTAATRRTRKAIAVVLVAVGLATGCESKDSGDLLQRTTPTSAPSSSAATPLAAPTTRSAAEQAALDTFFRGLAEAKEAAAKKAEEDKRAVDAFLASLAKKAEDDKRALDAFLASLAKKPATTAAPATPKAPSPTVAPAPSGCTNGTYVNAAGNTVCRPEASPSVPAGATAVCRDGTYSFSQSRSGTCSSHGGVSRWL